MVILVVVILSAISMVYGDGLLLLYRPKDITNECAFSRYLRFDISYGMGMSDTVTLVFRTLNDVDYECVIEIVTSSPQYLVGVIRYPTTIAKNCAVNRDALTILKRWRCTRICDLFNGDVYSPYFTFVVRDRLRFLFKSNSSINSDINANFYQVTATSARKASGTGCYRRNETICTVDETNYCFTTGVVCDGIKNCGVDDWFDERRSQCSMPVERLGYAPIVTVIAALLCAFIAGGHALLRFLPPHANSFFIFNENEDNRLCIDPLLVPKGTAPDIESFKRMSIIPVSGSLSSETNTNTELSRMSVEKEEELHELEEIIEENTVTEPAAPLPVVEEKLVPTRKSTMKSMTEKLQRLISVRNVIRGSIRKTEDAIEI